MTPRMQVLERSVAPCSQRQADDRQFDGGLRIVLED